MAARRIVAPVIAALALAAVACAAQYEGRNRWAQYEREMQDPIPDPPDARIEAEFAVGRLRFRSPFDGFRRRRWGTDANKEHVPDLVESGGSGRSALYATCCWGVECGFNFCASSFSAR